jgi:lipoprotein NlpD
VENGFHIVGKGDTLYSISFRYNLDYQQVALWNEIKSPYIIYPEQVLRLKAPVNQISASNNQIVNVPESPQQNSKQKVISPIQETTSTNTSISWRWPTKGKLIKLSSPTSQKGVNITGKRGQSILAAASGDVVYSGSGLLGYGKLIIIKHDGTYLSAYAHNDELLVREGMKVSSGQKIATMGIDDARPILHFEIRKQGKPVDPLSHLPKT